MMQQSRNLRNTKGPFHRAPFWCVGSSTQMNGMEFMCVTLDTDNKNETSATPTPALAPLSSLRQSQQKSHENISELETTS